MTPRNPGCDEHDRNCGHQKCAGQQTCEERTADGPGPTHFGETKAPDSSEPHRYDPNETEGDDP